jgi:hypothetical protein
MRKVLEVLAEAEEYGALTPNVIGAKLNLERVAGGGGQGGRGRGHRVFGRAQRIIFPLTRLRELGFVYQTQRPDGKSGTAYMITDTGREALL